MLRAQIIIRTRRWCPRHHPAPLRRNGTNERRAVTFRTLDASEKRACFALPLSLRLETRLVLRRAECRTTITPTTKLISGSSIIECACALATRCITRTLLPQFLLRGAIAVRSNSVSFINNESEPP